MNEHCHYCGQWISERIHPNTGGTGIWIHVWNGLRGCGDAADHQAMPVSAK